MSEVPLYSGPLAPRRACRDVSYSIALTSSRVRLFLHSVIARREAQPTHLLARGCWMVAGRRSPTLACDPLLLRLGATSAAGLLRRALQGLLVNKDTHRPRTLR